MAGTLDWDYAVARLNPDGSSDTSFGIDGVRRLPVDLTPSGRDVAVDAAFGTDGNILIVGTADNPDQNSEPTAVFRLLPAGSKDTSFGIGGLYWFGASAIQSYPQKISGDSGEDAPVVLATFSDSPSAFETALYPGLPIIQTWSPPDFRPADMYASTGTQSGRRFFAGVSTVGSFSDLTLLAVDPENQDPDPTFGTNGWVSIRATSPGGTWSSSANAIEHSGGRILAGGNAQRDFNDAFVVRLLPDGSLDPAFAGDGQQYMQWQFGGNVFSQVDDIDVQADGAIVIGGSASDGVSSTPVIARLDTAGAYDLEFAGTGWRTLPAPAGYALAGPPRSPFKRTAASSWPSTHRRSTQRASTRSMSCGSSARAPSSSATVLSLGIRRPGIEEVTSLSPWIRFRGSPLIVKMDRPQKVIEHRKVESPREKLDF